jgi:hypothetical protein
MLESGMLQRHLKTKVIPTFRARYYAMLKAMDTYLIPLGITISTGKPYTEISGHQNSTDRDQKDHSAQAGGCLIWSLLPGGLAGKGADLAAKALEGYDLEFAYGDMVSSIPV